MTTNNVWGVAGALVTVALVTTIVASPNSSAIIKGIGSSFSDALRAAQGK